MTATMARRRPKRMSVWMTRDAVRQRIKTVTRRHVATWKDLQAGDHLALIEKGQGLRKGERQVVICEVEVIDVRVEPLHHVTEYEVALEGLLAEALAACDGIPGATPAEWFIGFWLAGHGYRSTVAEAMSVECRRIEWRYLDDDEELPR